MNDKINYREKVPCFGNEPKTDIEVIKRAAEADRRRDALLDFLNDDNDHIQTAVITICIAIICLALIILGYFIHPIIQQILQK